MHIYTYRCDLCGKQYQESHFLKKYAGEAGLLCCNAFMQRVYSFEEEKENELPLNDEGLKEKE